jgi:hypothetical protein
MDSGFRRNDEEARFRPKALARSHTRPRVLQYFIVIPAKAGIYLHQCEIHADPMQVQGEHQFLARPHMDSGLRRNDGEGV